MIIYWYIATVLEVAQGARRSRCRTGGGLRAGTRRHRSELPGQEVDASSLGRQTSGEEQQVFWLSEVKEVAFTLRVDVTSLVSGLTVAQWLREEQAKVQRQDSNSDSKTRSWPVPSKINVITRMRSTLWGLGWKAWVLQQVLESSLSSAAAQLLPNIFPTPDSSFYLGNNFHLN